jgi:hypothetical protein
MQSIHPRAAPLWIFFPRLIRSSVVVVVVSFETISANSSIIRRDVDLHLPRYSTLLLNISSVVVVD